MIHKEDGKYVVGSEEADTLEEAISRLETMGGTSAVADVLRDIGVIVDAEDGWYAGDYKWPFDIEVEDSRACIHLKYSLIEFEVIPHKDTYILMGQEGGVFAFQGHVKEARLGGDITICHEFFDGEKSLTGSPSDPFFAELAIRARLYGNSVRAKVPILSVEAVGEDGVEECRIEDLEVLNE